MTKSSFSALVSLLYLGLLVFASWTLHIHWNITVPLVPFLCLSIIIGLVSENIRIEQKPKEIVKRFFIATGIGLLIGVPYLVMKHSLYVHLLSVSITVLFLLLSMYQQKHNLTSRLYEGVTLIQSVSLIYWILARGWLSFDTPGAYILSMFIIGMSLYTLVQSILHLKIKDSIKLTLSVWSSIIMLVFATDYLYSLFARGFDRVNLMDYLGHGAQYFFLGISLMYIIHNLSMLTVYMPNKHRHYNPEHMLAIKKMNQQHIARYSSKNIKTKKALVLIALMIGLYGCNYFYQLIPINTLIWAVFLLSSLKLHGRSHQI